VDLAVGECCEGPLFVGSDGRRPDRHAAAGTVARIARHAGITKTVGPHTLSHAFITVLRNDGAEEVLSESSAGVARCSDCCGLLRACTRGRVSKASSPKATGYLMTLSDTPNERQRMDQDQMLERVHAVETAQATQAATLAGAQATQAAAHAGTWSTMLAGAGGLIVGMFLALALGRARS
jgi:hypothetical protein